MKRKLSPLSVFFLIVLPLSAAAEALIVWKQLDILYPVLMWLPALAALAANLRAAGASGEKAKALDFFRRGGFRRCPVKYILLGVLLPLLYLLIPYMIYWRLYPESFAYSSVALSVILKDLVPVGVIGIFGSLLTAAGEEIGWRGFMVPALYQKFGLNKTLLFSSLIWCGWHLPLLIFGDYMAGTPLWYQIPAFILCIFPVGVMAGLLALKSRSLWPAAFLHAAHNEFDQAIFGLITRGDKMMYYVSETGFLTILCAWLLAAAMYFSMRRSIENQAE